VGLDQEQGVPNREPAFTRVYDEWKWHVGGEFPRGTPPAQGYVHIAMYLTWIVLRELENVHFFAELERATGRSLIPTIRRRKRTAGILRTATDGVFASDMLSPVAKAFTDNYYDGEPSQFLTDWVETFGPATDTYSVPDSWETYAAIEPILDDRFRDWHRAHDSPERGSVAGRPIERSDRLDPSDDDASVRNDVLGRLAARPGVRLFSAVGQELDVTTIDAVLGRPLAISETLQTPARMAALLSDLALGPALSAIRAATEFAGWGPDAAINVALRKGLSRDARVAGACSMALAARGDAEAFDEVFATLQALKDEKSDVLTPVVAWAAWSLAAMNGAEALKSVEAELKLLGIHLPHVPSDDVT
jgi:hypothetical protein